MNSQLPFWLTLSRLPVGPRARLALVQQFADVEKIFCAARAEVVAVLIEAGARDTTAAAAAKLIDEGVDEVALAADLAWLAQERRSLLTWGDDDYPKLLRELPDAPVVLYVHGERALLAQSQLAIVGSRNPTPGGRENAHAFGAALARVGLVITSGLALGVDGAAHRGALAGGGATIAVAGTGLDRVYPARHRELAHAIVQHGALVSEFPLGTPPKPENFPIRNRLISGLSLGTLVIEAALQSGSLITARLAAEQGREVFALPGSIHAPQSRGCHALIRQGAKLVETAQDVLEELGPLALAARSDADVTSSNPSVVNSAEADLLEHLGFDPIPMDTLIARSGLTAENVSSMLLRLELRGLVLAGPGGTYQRACST